MAFAFGPAGPSVYVPPLYNKLYFIATSNKRALRIPIIPNGASIGNCRMEYDVV
jgi:hypothetical protein